MALNEEIKNSIKGNHEDVSETIEYESKKFKVLPNDKLNSTKDTKELKFDTFLLPSTKIDVQNYLDKITSQNYLNITRPTNITMPNDYKDILKEPEELSKVLKDLKSNESITKICTYNVASLNAALKKGLKEYIAIENPTILCLQETKLQESPPPSTTFDSSTYPFQYYWCSTSKKGYSGTAILSKVTPISNSFGFEKGYKDDEGRVITLEFEEFYIVNAYVPNSGDKLKTLDKRMAFDKAMRDHLESLEKKGKSVIYTGDLNVAHLPIDLARPKENLRSAGFTIEERTNFNHYLNTLIDLDRHFHPKELNRYTFYGFRGNSRSKGTGWRLDYFLVSKNLLEKVIGTEIRMECYGASDHLPSILWLKTLKNENNDKDLEQKVVKKQKTSITSFFKKVKTM